MIRTLKILLLSSATLACSVSLQAEEQFVFQLGAVNSDGNAVVVENRTGSKEWKTVFNGNLPGCLMNEYTNIPLTDKTMAHHHSLSTFHQPLGNDRFAFGCSNGYVFVGSSAEEVFTVASPSPGFGYFNLSYANSPIYLVHSAEFNQRYKKDWLFAAQHGHLFIIDLDKKALVTVPGWSENTYLSMEDGRKGVDHSKPMTGLDLYQDKEGTFHVLGVMERNLSKKESFYSRALLQSVALPGGIPASRWEDIKDEPINKKGDGILQYADTAFGVTLSGEKTEHVVERNTPLRGDFSGLSVDPYTHAMILRGKHHKLMVVRYPVEPVSLAYIGAWGKLVSSKVEGHEPQLLEDGFSKTFRVVHDLQDDKDLRPKVNDDDKRNAHHHMINMKKGIIFSAEADFEGFGRYVYQCDTGLSSGEAWKQGAWIEPRRCDWVRASANYLMPAEIEGLKSPLTGLKYFHSFTTQVMDERGVANPKLPILKDEL